MKKILFLSVFCGLFLLNVGQAFAVIQQKHLMFDVHVEELAYSYVNPMHATPAFVHDYDFSCNFSNSPDCSEIDSSSCHANHTMVCLEYRNGIIAVSLGPYHASVGSFSLADLERGQKVDAVMKEHFIGDVNGDGVGDVGTYAFLPKSYIILKVKGVSLLSKIFG